jgi:CspA family cold shock protein
MNDNSDPLDPLVQADTPVQNNAQNNTSHVVQINTPPPYNFNLVLDEVPYNRNSVGEFIGQVKWFNDRLGYGFCTVCTGPQSGRDIFVHHSGIQPITSNYKTLCKGEYIHFNIMNGHNGLQAIDVTGVFGGPLMCDVSPMNNHRHDSLTRRACQS